MVSRRIPCCCGGVMMSTIECFNELVLCSTSGHLPHRHSWYGVMLSLERHSIHYHFIFSEVTFSIFVTDAPTIVTILIATHLCLAFCPKLLGVKLATQFCAISYRVLSVYQTTRSDMVVLQLNSLRSICHRGFGHRHNHYDKLLPVNQVKAINWIQLAATKGFSRSILLLLDDHSTINSRTCAIACKQEDAASTSGLEVGYHGPYCLFPQFLRCDGAFMGRAFAFCICMEAVSRVSDIMGITRTVTISTVCADGSSWNTHLDLWLCISDKLIYIIGDSMRFPSIGWICLNEDCRCSSGQQWPSDKYFRHYRFL